MNIKEKLENLIKEEKKDTSEQNELKIHVYEHALEYEDTDEIKHFFKNLLECSGCVGGTVSHLISYTDTHKFFDKYYHEIMELTDTWKEDVGEPFQHNDDLKNDYAWFGFERMAQIVADELEDEG